MSVFNEELEQLQARIARKQKLEAMLKSLHSERDALIAEERKLAAVRDREQRDVDALEKVSLSAIISSIRGNKEEKLNRERIEARAAAEARYCRKAPGEA